MEKEVIFSRQKVEIETRDDGQKYISFYAIVFNDLSRNMGGWHERILPEAVANADFSEWCVIKNHDRNQILGASWSGTANYTIDQRGVKCTTMVGNSTIWKDTVDQIERGDLNFASFGFTPANDGYNFTTETRDGKQIEVGNVKSIRKIWDLSPVMVPAYPTTEGISMAKREYDAYKQREQPEQKEQQEREYNEYKALALQLQINN